MKIKAFVTILILAFIVAVYLLFNMNSETEEIISDNILGYENNGVNFKPLKSSELDLMLRQKDFKLIDVHIPEQKHIPGTDYFIPFNEIDKLVTVLLDKNEKIVLYCRSGTMSKIVAKELKKRGYTNIFDLTNGLNEWVNEGRDTAPIGTIVNI